MKRNTLDIDPVRLPNGYIIPITREGIAKVIRRVRGCPHLAYLKFRWSPSGNGIHVEFWCLRDCDTCRLVYDSPRRFTKDLMRPPHTRDVLWGDKAYRKAGHVLKLQAGEWMR